MRRHFMMLIAMPLMMAASAQNVAPAASHVEAYDYGELEADPAFEQVDPPPIAYEDYAGPDPVLEGSTPPAPQRQTAGQQRLEELWLEDLEGREGAADTGPAEFGTRSIPEVIMALCFVLGLIVLALYLVKRLGARTPLLAGATLGQVLGRVYLSPKASLHFVRTGGKVLVIGVTQESVQLVETFDASAFDGVPAEDAASGAPRAASAQGIAFLAQLREQSERIRQPNPQFEPDDGDIANLRDDIERLQRLLREATRE